ncbi:MAG: hypothetical protein CMK07_06925 [Ponticaulis sp.]|nr:hypothetical protein [Ponticaulis sp.]
MSPKFIRQASRFHKILGLVIGLQILFWMASGLYFTIFPIENIRGDHLRAEMDHGVLEPEQVTISVQDAMDRSGIWGFRAELDMFLGKPVWQISNSHETVLVDATSGEKLSPLPEAVARSVVTQGVPGLAREGGSYFLMTENAPREYGGRLPVWVFETESSGERAYVDPSTGDIRAVRTTEWRIFDVFWRFHIMDITGKDVIATWWMKIAAFLGLSLTIAGFIILFQRLIRRRLFS